MDSHPSQKVLLPTNFQLCLGICCGICLTLLSGCNQQNRPLKVSTDIEAKTLLLSEVEASDDRDKMGVCEIEVVNPSSEVRELRLVRTGCACYGVTLDGKAISNGEVAQLPPGSTKHAAIRFQPAVSHSEKTYTADFSTTSSDGTARPIAVKCRQRVISDIRLTPNVLTVEATSDQPVSSVQNLTVEHNYRSHDGAASQPQFSRLPPEMTVIEIVAAGPPKLVIDDLWQQIWKIKVNLEFAEDHAQKGSGFPFEVSARDQKGHLATAQGTISLHTRQTVVFPNRVHFGKIPVGSTRTRRVFLTSTEDGFFRIRINPETLPPYVNVFLNEHSDQRHLVEFSVTPNQPGPFSEVIKLTTDMYDVAEIIIRLEGVAEVPHPKPEEKSKTESDPLIPETEPTEANAAPAEAKSVPAQETPAESPPEAAETSSK